VIFPTTPLTPPSLFNLLPTWYSTGLHIFQQNTLPGEKLLREVKWNWSYGRFLQRFSGAKLCLFKSFNSWQI